MQIREAKENDIPGILDVLKASLGETSSQKTEEVWRFKHISNPFGKSLVLIAIEGEDIIGVRAFMRWKWQFGEKFYSAFRAVDTATHPNHQGKGVFKKLTLKAIESAKEENGNFIFNTPNGQSLPGYLKMGWVKVDKLNVQISPTFPFHWSLKNIDKYQIDIRIDDNVLDQICLHRNSKIAKDLKYFTPKTREYLKWRYEENPLQKYQIFADKDCYIAGYVKQHKYFKELRIVEILQRDIKESSHIPSILRKWTKIFGANILTMAARDNLFQLKLKGNYGPVLTVRNLDLNEESFDKVLDLTNIKYSLGDLELF